MKLRLLPALLLAGCAPASAPPGAALAQIAGGPLGPPKQCVETRTNQSLIIIDQQNVAYRDGPTLWVSRLASQCRSLTPFSTIIIERTGTEACRGDSFRTVEHGSDIPSGHCVLGNFTPYRAI